ncbi:hypothetical protein [Chitiniphilus eburneus]|nr:hypothetical protein [Chitiniphilus eburneus]
MRSGWQSVLFRPVPGGGWRARPIWKEAAGDDFAHALGGGMLALLAIAAWAGYCWRGERASMAEDVRPAAQERQADGSVVATRVPTARPDPPPHLLPRGAQEERRVAVWVQVPPVTPVVDAMGVVHCDCPPVTVDLSLVRLDGGRRVIASSPNGVVLDALDVPIDPAPLPPAPRPWAVGMSYGVRGELGAWLERDVGRVRLGADIQQERDEWNARLRVGWLF